MFFNRWSLFTDSVVTLETNSDGILFNDVVTMPLPFVEPVPKQLETSSSFLCLMLQAGDVISPTKRMVPEATGWLEPVAACKVAGIRARSASTIRERFIINSSSKMKNK